MAKKSGKQNKEGGLWIPNHIRNILRSVLSDSEKMLLADIYSFRDKGFYKSNKTIAKEYMASERTVSRWIANIQKGGFVYTKNPKGYYRTMWAKSHPDVQAAVKLWYRDKEISKTEVETGGKLSTPLRQCCPTELDKSGEATATKRVFPLRQNRPTTNKETYKETKRETTAADLPLPAGGQASQLLEDRKVQVMAGVEKLIKKLRRKFGSAKGRRTSGLTSVDFEHHKQKQIQA